MTTTYRVTMTDTTGAETIRTGLTQDDRDALVDQYEARDTAYPVGVFERQKKDGTWTVAGGWDVRPRDLTATPTRVDYAAERTAEMLAVAALNDAKDRRENRRAYYLRTGR